VSKNILTKRNMNCFAICEGCEYKVITLKKYSIKEKCKFNKNNYIYKNGSPIKCTKFKLKNNNVKAIRQSKIGILDVKE